MSLISPSFIRLFRDDSNMFNVIPWMQHLKKPPFFLQSLANLDCSWRSKFFINPKYFVTGTYIFCTLLETLCFVRWIYIHKLPVPRNGTDIGKSIRIFPSLAHALFILCIGLQHLWVHPVIEVVVILELLNFVQFLLSEGLPVFVHIIGFPFLWVLVTVRDQATVVRILVHVLNAVKQLTCRQLLLLVFQFEHLTNKEY